MYPRGDVPDIQEGVRAAYQLAREPSRAPALLDRTQTLFECHRFGVIRILVESA